MGNALIIAEHKNGALKKASLAAFSCARDYVAKNGGEFHILLIGHDIAAVADEAACYGAAKVHTADHEKLGPYLAESHAAVAAKVAGEIGAELVGATATAMAKDMLPRLAAKLGAGMASDIMASMTTAIFSGRSGRATPSWPPRSPPR